MDDLVKDTLAVLADARALITAQAAEIERLRGQLDRACDAADAVLAPICAEIGAYLYNWADCPNLIETAHGYGVKVPAKDFADLYAATDRQHLKDADNG